MITYQRVLKKIAKYILRFRIAILVFWLISLFFCVLQLPKFQTEYGLVQLLTKSDSSYINFQKFQSVFGEEEIVYVLGIEKDPLKDLALFQSWNHLASTIQAVDGVDTLICMTKGLYAFEKDTLAKKLRLKPIDVSFVQSDADLLSYKQQVLALPFYKNMLYTDSAHWMMVVLNKQAFDSPERDKIVQPIEQAIAHFENSLHQDIHVSGMPFIRSKMRQLVQRDFVKFILLSFVFCFGVIVWVFKDFIPSLVSFLVIITGLLWSVGVLVMMGVKVTILTGIIPTLVIIIGVPNCIYIVNHFIKEYAASKDKEHALTHTIHRIGQATFLTNITTALGFFTFYFTGSQALEEFGLIAALNIVLLYILCIVGIPILFSILPYKSKKQKQSNTDKHLIERIVHWVQFRRKIVYLSTFALLLVSLVGVYQVRTTGNITDELPADHQLFTDLRWLERTYGGIVPLNIYIESKNQKIYHERFLKKVEQLDQKISAHPLISEGMSMADLVKFAKQGFYNNDSSKYQLLSNSERLFMMPYLSLDSGKSRNPMVDSTQRITRINYLVKDLNAQQMDAFSKEIEQILYEIFPKEKYRSFVTGASYVFLKGTEYLLQNLFMSILLAIFVIGALMAMLFQSVRIILIAVVCNLIPLILTLGFMGFVGIALKPSTILVYSIAFGIAVDDTIHFLATFKELVKKDFSNAKEAVIATLRSVGDSMFFTSIALFFGFIVFVSSEFQGTKAMGVLLSFCLLVAMISNLVLLPSLLMPKDKKP